MALRDQLNVSTRGELYNFVMQSDQVLTVLGVTTAGDIPAELWYFAATSTLTDDGVNVIKPNAIPLGNPGRYVRGTHETDWPAVKNKPVFSTVATSGNYNDLINKPIIPDPQIQSDYSQNNSTSADYIKNKPDLSVYYLNTNPAGYISGITSSQVSTALGYTPATNNRSLIINGISQDLSSDRTWTVGDLLSTGFYSNPAWITSLTWSKITGTPNTLAGYGIVDGVTSSSLSVILNDYISNSTLNGTLSNYVTNAGLTTGLANKENTIVSGTTTQYWRGDKSWQNLTSSVVTEGSNLYFTNSRARAAISLTTTGSGIATYDTSTGTLNIPTPISAKTYLGTTDGSGNYTITYSTPYSSVPDVQPQLQAGTASQVARITSTTVNGFTIQVTNRSSVNLLGVEVLLASTTPVSGASVSVLVTPR